MTERFVLDASAVLCLIRGEPGADVVAAALPESSISAVNLAEVVAKLVDLGMNEDLIARVLDPLRLRGLPFDSEQAHASGLLRRLTRALGLSLGDRACLSLAAQLGATALTTDRTWSAVAATAKVVMVR
ncbi:MAG: type II toxin-antitoxin system VapC family toxin [Caulobacteraceae bacterium]|nr:type II toxin-antitoxin system VapC family toxin [Caulobacteraceae bacterium]